MGGRTFGKCGPLNAAKSGAAVTTLSLRIDMTQAHTTLRGMSAADRMTHRPLPENLVLRPEEDDDGWDVEALYDVVFGPGRYAKGSSRIREGFAHDRAVSFVADRNGRVIGAIRQTRVTVGGAPAYLLGPLAVAETAAKQGIGRALLTHAIEAARATRADGIVLVGDPPFYAPSGFVPAAGTVQLGVPVEAHRLQSLTLRRPLAGALWPSPW